MIWLIINELLQAGGGCYSLLMRFRIARATIFMSAMLGLSASGIVVAESGQPGEVVPLYGTVLDMKDSRAATQSSVGKAGGSVLDEKPATQAPALPAATPSVLPPAGSQVGQATGSVLGSSVNTDDLPRRGINMEAVIKQYGEPNHRDPAIGDPPITRWDYDDFSVFFEHRLVLHSVVPESPPDIQHRDQLISTP